MSTRTTPAGEKTVGEGFSPPPPLGVTYITPSLFSRRRRRPNHRAANVALQQLTGLMAVAPDEVLGRFVEQVMKLTSAAAAGLSLIESDSPGCFVWRHVHGF